MKKHVFLTAGTHPCLFFSVPYNRMHRLSSIENMRKTMYFFCDVILALKTFLEIKNSFDLKNNLDQTLEM